MNVEKKYAINNLWSYLSVFVVQSNEDFWDIIFFGMIDINMFQSNSWTKRSNSNNDLLNNTLRNDAGQFY